MTLFFNKTKTWDTTTPNNGELFDAEFEQIYKSIRDLAGTEQNPDEITGDYSIIRHRGWGGKRQTILTGKTDIDTVDNNCKAAFLTFGSMANSVKINCAVDPLTIAISDGYDQWGAVEYTIAFQNNSDIEPLEWINLIGDKDYFLYIDIETDSQSITYGNSEYVPVYSYSAPTVTPEDSGQHWFDLSTYKMKFWNGSEWITKKRIFIGEVQCSVDGIEEIIPYALHGEFEFNWIDVATSQKYELWHNIGTTNISCEVFVNDTTTSTCRRQTNGVFEESIRYCDYQYYYNSNSGIGAAKRIQRNNVVIGIGNSYVAHYNTCGDSFYNTTGTYKIRLKRTF